MKFPISVGFGEKKNPFTTRCSKWIYITKILVRKTTVENLQKKYIFLAKDGTSPRIECKYAEKNVSNI